LQCGLLPSLAVGFRREAQEPLIVKVHRLGDVLFSSMGFVRVYAHSLHPPRRTVLAEGFGHYREQGRYSQAATSPPSGGLGTGIAILQPI
jgi:hypothetical protein